MEIRRDGTQAAVRGSSENFTGDVTVQPLLAAHPPARALAASVTFEPCARTDWHDHPLGQALFVTEGLGFVQSRGGPVQVIRPGDVIWTPPGEVHWHGAAPDCRMTHLVVVEEKDGKAVRWMEKVTDDEYRAAIDVLRAEQAATASNSMAEQRR